MLKVTRSVSDASTDRPRDEASGAGMGSDRGSWAPGGLPSDLHMAADPSTEDDVFGGGRRSGLQHWGPPKAEHLSQSGTWPSDVASPRDRGLQPGRVGEEGGDSGHPRVLGQGEELHARLLGREDFSYGWHTPPNSATATSTTDQGVTGRPHVGLAAGAVTDTSVGHVFGVQGRSNAAGGEKQGQRGLQQELNVPPEPAVAARTPGRAAPRGPTGWDICAPPTGGGASTQPQGVEYGPAGARGGAQSQGQWSGQPVQGRLAGGGVGVRGRDGVGGAQRVAELAAVGQVAAAPQGNVGRPRVSGQHTASESVPSIQPRGPDKARGMRGSREDSHRNPRRSDSTEPESTSTAAERVERHTQQLRTAGYREGGTRFGRT